MDDHSSDVEAESHLRRLIERQRRRRVQHPASHPEAGQMTADGSLAPLEHRGLFLAADIAHPIGEETMTIGQMQYHFRLTKQELAAAMMRGELPTTDPGFLMPGWRVDAYIEARARRRRSSFQIYLTGEDRPRPLPSDVARRVCGPDHPAVNAE